MSAARSAKSHTITWTLSVLAVPILYVLTWPLFLLWLTRNGPVMDSPSWVRLYAIPAELIDKSSLLHEPMDDYVKWCMKLSGRSSLP